MRQTFFSISGALLGVLTAACAHAQAKPLQAIEVVSGNAPTILPQLGHDDANITVDGHIDEAVWARIKPYNDLKVVEPDTLADAPYDTDARFFYTERGIYVSFDMTQPAEMIVRRFAARDAFEVNRDNVGFVLDTSGDGRYGYWMNMSLGDSEMDGTVLPERNFSREWDGAWYGATQRTEKGWSAEFFVPWAQMTMPKQNGIRRIGLYFVRKVAYLNERWAWPGLPKSQPRFMSAMHPLQLENVDPRQQWSLFPYASGTFDRVDTDSSFKAGLDLFWRPSSNFQLTATVNPDFGAVESDDVVVNFTADETFFPEKRLFFQEGREIFNLSGRQPSFGAQPLTVVNTRRIGGRPRQPDLPPGVDLPRREALRPADVIGALKLTGQIGSFRYGVLAAFENQTDFTADDGLVYAQDGRDFGVFRVLYEDSKGAAYRGLGWVSTLVANPEANSVVHGVDYHYLSTDGIWNINGQLLYSDLEEIGSGKGFLADFAYTPRQGIRHSLELSFFDDKIDVNDLGFQVRNNVNDLVYRFEWIKSGLARVRDFSLSPTVQFSVNGAGFRVNNFLGSGGSVTLTNLDTLGGFLGYSPSRFDDRNSFGNGTYEIDPRVFANISYRTDTSRIVSLFGRLNRRGESLGGRSLTSTLGITWRPFDNLSLDMQATYVDQDGWLLHQEDENFTTFRVEQWRPQFQFEFFPTAKQQLRLAFQWVGFRAKEDEFYILPEGTNKLIPSAKPPGPTDGFSVSQLNFQIRYRWQIAPLSDLFVVYTKGDFVRFDDLIGFGDLFQQSWQNPLGDMLVVKLRYRVGS